jgi:hypothetical protein
MAIASIAPVSARIEAVVMRGARRLVYADQPGPRGFQDQYEYSIVIAVNVSVFSVPGKTSLLFLSV